jgi:hypothetical protein
MVLVVLAHLARVRQAVDVDLVIAGLSGRRRGIHEGPTKG